MEETFVTLASRWEEGGIANMYTRPIVLHRVRLLLPEDPAIISARPPLRLATMSLPLKDLTTLKICPNMNGPLTQEPEPTDGDGQTWSLTAPTPSS